MAHKLLLHVLAIVYLVSNASVMLNHLQYIVSFELMDLVGFLLGN